MATFPFDLGADIFAIIDGVEVATVDRLDPDSGETMTDVPIATAAEVPYFSPDYRTAATPVSGGEVAETISRFFLKAAAIPFTPVKRDRLTLADESQWSIEDVDVGGFGTVYTVNAVRKR